MWYNIELAAKQFQVLEKKQWKEKAQSETVERIQSI